MDAKVVWPTSVFKVCSKVYFVVLMIYRFLYSKEINNKTASVVTACASLSSDFDFRLPWFTFYGLLFLLIFLATDVVFFAFDLRLFLVFIAVAHSSFPAKPYCFIDSAYSIGRRMRPFDLTLTDSWSRCQCLQRFQSSFSRLWLLAKTSNSKEYKSKCFYSIFLKLFTVLG